MTSADDVGLVLRNDGVVLRREHPELAGTLDWLLRTGRLSQVLPGVYASVEQAGEFRTRVLALSRWAPDAVLTEKTAARLTFWPSQRPTEVQCALRCRGSYPGFTFSRRLVPPELVHEQGGLRLTTPALTALDLCGADADAIDTVLRTRCATLSDLWRAFELTRHRRGNQQRLRHLIDSRNEPWSAAERISHRLLREAGISGWRSNLPTVGDGRLFYIDIAFAKLRVAVEIDGRLHEDDPDIFENDRWRQNALVLDDWLVLRFTWTMLTEHPEMVIDKVWAALAKRGQGRT